MLIIYYSGIPRYMNKPQEVVVFCEDDFVLTCDTRQGLHSVWRARPVSSEDCNILETTVVQQHTQVTFLC